MNKGDIVLVPFPFSDLSGTKLRPALVLHVSHFDITIAFISTQLHVIDDGDVVINPSSQNGLKKQSVIRLAKIATLHKEIIIGKLGKMEQATYAAINSAISKNLFL